MRLRLRRKRGRRRPVSEFLAGFVGLILVIALAFGAFTKFANPFASQFTVRATFANANGLVPGALVRIAGVNVGTVSGVAPASGCTSQGSDQSACHAAAVTLTIQPNGLPLHQDATFAIRPRTFLEGNFFVDVAPGTPQAPVAGNGHTFPIQQGVEPVQFDQVLTSLQFNTRRNLQTLLQQLGKAVKVGGPAYNRSIQYWLPAYEYSSIVSHDFLGLAPHDLSNYVAASGTVAGALDMHPANLESLVTNFNRTANAFARVNLALEHTIMQLPRTLAASVPAFNALNAAFPPLRALARGLIPGVQSTPAMVRASLPFVTQLNDLVQPAELRGLVADLRPTVPALARLTLATIPLMRNAVRPLASCVIKVIHPWSVLSINDGTFNASNGFPTRQTYVETVDFLPGLAGESRNFDANGPFIRILGTGGTLTYSLQPGLFGQSLSKIDAVQPQLPPGGQRPPYQPNVPCETQAPITNLTAPAGGPPSQTPTNLSAPGALARWNGVTQNALPAIKRDLTGTGLTLDAAHMSK